MKNFSVKPKTIVAAIVALAVLIGGFSFYGFYNSTRNAGIEMETNLMAQYDDNKNELSAAAMQISETLGIADRSSDKVNEIWMNAIQGRYDGKMAAGNDGMFSALAEDNPDLTANAESYAKVQDVVVSARNAYKNKQTKLISQAAQYKTWLKSGVVRSQIVKMQGFPSDDLTVKNSSGDAVFGRAALEKISAPIIDASTVEAYDTGTLEPMITPNPPANK